MKWWQLTSFDIVNKTKQKGELDDAQRRSNIEILCCIFTNYKIICMSKIWQYVSQPTQIDSILRANNGITYNYYLTSHMYLWLFTSTNLRMASRNFLQMNPQLKNLLDGHCCTCQLALLSFRYGFWPFDQVVIFCFLFLPKQRSLQE